MKVYWTVYFGKFRRSEYTFQGENAKRDALRAARVAVARDLKATIRTVR